MSEVIKYKSDNGYSGALYGESSMSIYDPDGKEVFHTGFRRKEINSLEALKEHVDTFPELMELLSGKAKAIHDDFKNHPEENNF